MSKSNIVVEFACSKDANGNFKKYHPVAGTTISEQFNETLDSATVLLTHIQDTDRLNLIKPYDFVHIYDWDEENQTTQNDSVFNKIYLVDNFFEKELNNQSGHKYYEYTINLMNTTKLLEKIQLPNLSITHKVNSDGTTNKKIIYEYIKEYIELYSPKIKIYTGVSSNWEYQRIIKVPDEYISGTQTHTDFYNKFNIPCADMTLTAPTLRQALTTLMQQVSCIPILIGRELSFLDFKGTQSNFVENSTINFVQRSLSSDSYVNSLVNMGSSVLDTNNKVICESLGFRDIKNCLIKQTENLNLETKFPIYKINKVKMNYPVVFLENVITSSDCYNYYEAEATTTQELYNLNHHQYILQQYSGNSYHIRITRWQTFNGWSSTVSNIKLRMFHIDLGTTISEETKTFSNFGSVGSQMNANNVYFSSEEGGASEDHYLIFGSSEYFNIPDDVNLIILIGNTSSSASTDTFKPFVVFVKENNTWLYDLGSKGFYDSYYYKKIKSEGDVSILDQYFSSAFESLDITHLVKENSERSLLSTNFLDASSSSRTISELGNYYYSTVGYSIGSNKITGFSTVYNEGSASVVGWITLNKTIIENIFNHFLKTSFIFTSSPLFSLFFFDIEYQPLNSFNISYLKDEDIPLQLEQYNSSGDSVSDFDRLSTNMQQQVNRIGQENLSISQRTQNLSNIQPLNSLFRNDYTIFSRTIGIDNYSYSVSYQASKNAILKDYFTSIRTKYRAYQNVDYSQSVLRKEKDVIYLCISENNYQNQQNLDKKIYFGSGETNSRNYLEYLADGFKKTVDTLSVGHNETKTNLSPSSGEGEQQQVVFSIHYSEFDNKNITSSVPTLTIETPTIIVTTGIGRAVILSDLTTYGFNSNGEYYLNITVQYETNVFESTNLVSISVTTYMEIEFYVSSLTANNKTLSAMLEESKKTTSGTGYGETQICKNDISVITNNNTLAIIYEQPDNASLGTYFKNAGVDSNLGGIVQVWQDWSEYENYNEYHKVFYTKEISLNVRHDAIYYMPVLKYPGSSNANKNQASWYLSTINNEKMFSIVKDNSASFSSDTDMSRFFYKDSGERLNHTLQFIYYADSDNIFWTELFIKNCSFVDNCSVYPNRIIGLPNDYDITTISINETSLPNGARIFHWDDNLITITYNNNKLIISINWEYIPNYNNFKISYYNTVNQKTQDFIAFSRQSSSSTTDYYYIYLNDTKTHHIYKETNGIISLLNYINNDGTVVYNEIEEEQ